MEQKNILFDAQNVVVGILSADAQLSSCQFLAENSKDIDYSIKNALGKQGIVGVVMTPKAQFIGNYEATEIAWQCDCEIEIVENPVVNRGKPGSFDVITGQDVAMRVFEVLCNPTNGNSGKFSAKTYEQGEESGLLVNKCTF
jgi:hypothetical protein